MLVDVSTPATIVTAETILAAALSVLSEDGAAALRMRTVAGRAGCSTTGLYTHFGSKQGLVDALFVDGFERFDAALASTRQHRDAVQYLAARCMTYRRWAVANPTHYMLMFGGSVPEYVPSEPAAARAMQSFDDLVTTVACAAATAQWPGDPVTLAYHVWASIHGYVMLELRGMPMTPSAMAEETFRDGLQMTLHGLGGRR